MKHTLTQIFTAVGDQFQHVLETVATTGQLAIELDQPLAASGTPITLNATADPNQLKSLYMVSTVDCAVSFRDAADSEVGSVLLAPNVPYIWMTNQNPAADLVSDYITAEFEGIRLTNSSNPLTAGTFKFRALTDPSA